MALPLHGARRAVPLSRRQGPQSTPRTSTEGHPRAAPAEGPIEPDAPREPRRAGPSRPPARHAPRIPPRSRHCGRGQPPCPGASRRRARAGPLRPKCPSAARHQPCPSRPQPRGGGPPSSGAGVAGPAVEQVATGTARGCRERAAYGSSASASRPRVQLKARHAGCAAEQPARRARLQRRRPHGAALNALAVRLLESAASRQGGRRRGPPG